VNLLKKGILRSVGLLLIIIVLGLGITHTYSRLNESKIEFRAEDELSHYAIHNYKIDARFMEEEKLLEVKQQVKYKNTHNLEFESIYFHLYPNAFKEKEKVPFLKEELEHAYPKGFQSGYIDIEEVLIEGKKANFELGGLNNTIMSIKLSEVLKPNEEVLISFKYKVRIPPISSRFGYGENTYNLGNWYPIAAVYDSKGWNLDPYYEIGDPFYSEVGNYEVTLRLPEEYELATTGNILYRDKVQKEDVGYKEQIWNVEAKAVRDFAWVISKNFILKNDSINGIDINVYYFKNQQGNKALEAAKDSIKIFSELFGEYPYGQFSVVSCDFFIGGMEYPNLVYIDHNIFSRDSTLILEYIIVHETAHQWWYGIIGNDQVNEPWIDEALTEYSTILYYREKYGEDTMMSMLKSMVVDDYVRTKEELEDKDESIAKGIDEFKDNREYSGIVYSKGAMMFYELEREVGRENFIKILQYYMSENKFTNVTEKDIKNITKAVTGEDYQEFFDQWLRDG
jgi:hypothetical protein